MIDPQFDLDENEIEFGFVVGDREASPVPVALQALPGVIGLRGRDFLIEFDEAGSGFRIWDGLPHEEGSDVVEWFTTEKLLWDRSRARPGIYGLDDVREFSTYDLLYVGIAKNGDSFDRLLARGHKARQEILANEPQRYSGARVSDETFLFLFQTDPLIMQTFEPKHGFKETDLSGEYDAKRIVADAEKAFVSLLKPE